MRNPRQERTYRISIQYGDSDLGGIIDQLAVQTIQKCSNNFYSSNPRVKKNLILRQAL
ncbi:hypothetical protein PAECIP111892_03612 [Paenibacillus auburnensis]|uniref:Uncharacterized protein n=1 Tax=Paenibacillus auburnensis TaxID=2905649 RepID=A0ABN8GR57_9BACL|nr:hypothetical protein PAECIP111892_03612 [Paenibacillus auburnensis]